MRIFQFEVEYYEEEEEQVKVDKGLVAGESLSHAVKRLEELYFEDATIPYSMKIDFIEDLGKGIVSFDEIPDFEED